MNSGVVTTRVMLVVEGKATCGSSGNAGRANVRFGLEELTQMNKQ